MPSKRPKRRRSRQRPFPVGALLWSLFLVNVGIGLGVSPLTAVRKVRVVGAAEPDRERIESVATGWRDVPLLRLNAHQVEWALANDSEIDTATFQPNILGRAVVRVTLRKPVGRLANTRLFLDANGTVFRSNRSIGKLPLVMPPKGALGADLTFAGDWESAEVAGLCRNLSVQVPNVEWTVELSERGVISLKTDSGAEVVMGSSDSLPQKVEKLRALLEAKPELLEKVRRVVLTAPEAPMVVR